MAEASATEISSGGDSKKLIIIIIAVVILLGIAGGTYAYFMLSDDEPVAEYQDVIEEQPAEEAARGTEQASASAAAKGGEAFYVGMPRPFVFNVPGYGRERLVQIKVQLLVRGSDNDTAARKHIPLIEDTLLTVFSSSNAEKLATRSGKDELRADAQHAVQKALEPIVGNTVVERVLFIGFVMQ